MSATSVMLITGTSRGIGRYLAERYAKQGFAVLGCSRGPTELDHANYEHHSLDIANEGAAIRLFSQIRRRYGRLDVLINNAGVAAMNHSLLTPLSTVERIFTTNVSGTFLFCREAAKLMKQRRCGRIVNLVSVATPLRLEGESVYAASKAAVVSLTQILARELAGMNITVNALGPAPTRTDLVRAVPEDKLDSLLARQAIPRFAEPADIANVIDFFIRPDSDFVTGQVIYLGGV